MVHVLAHDVLLNRVVHVWFSPVEIRHLILLFVLSLLFLEIS